MDWSKKRIDERIKELEKRIWFQNWCEGRDRNYPGEEIPPPYDRMSVIKECKDEIDGLNNYLKSYYYYQ